MEWVTPYDPSMCETAPANRHDIEGFSATSRADAIYSSFGVQEVRTSAQAGLAGAGPDAGACSVLGVWCAGRFNSACMSIRGRGFTYSAIRESRLTHSGKASMPQKCYANVTRKRTTGTRYYNS